MSSSQQESTKADIPDIHAESVEELREAFELFDTKGAGKIPMSELVDSMQTLGFQDKNPMMFEMMLKISAKRRGENTTFVQFAEDLADLIRGVNQERDLRIIFNMLDDGNTGRITLDNLKKVAKEFGDTITDAELMEMMDTAKHVNSEDQGTVDDKISNEVSFFDFYNLMTKGKMAKASLPNKQGFESSQRSFTTQGGDVSLRAATDSGGARTRSFREEFGDV